MDRTINLGFSTIIKVAVVGIGLYVTYLLVDILLLLVTAIVIASAIGPLRDFIVKHVRLPKILTIASIYILLFFGFGFLFYGIIPIFIEQSEDFLNSIPNFFSALQAQLPSGFISDLFNNSFASFNSFDYNTFQSLIKSTTKSSITVISSITSGVVSFFLLIILSLYFSYEDKNIQQFFKSIVPIRYEKYVDSLINRTQKNIGLWVKGQVILGLIAGIFVFLTLTLLGVPNALFLATLAAVAEIIPIFGPVLAIIPAALLSFLTGGIGLSVIVIVAYLLIQQFQTNLIYPLVVTKIVGIPVPLIIISLFAGFALFGFLGVLISIPMATFVRELYVDLKTGKL